VSGEPATPRYWARLAAEEVAAVLGTGGSGLAGVEAARRLARWGPNALPRAARRPWFVELGSNFVHLFALLLWAGAVLAWIAGMPELGWAIVGVVLVNGLFSYWQEFQAERAAEALEALLPRDVCVRRDGVERLVRAELVVPGDVLVLSEGEAVPADARVIACTRLRLDASSLTGESRPVPRVSQPIDAGEVAALANLVFAGTQVASGRGEAIVFATGAHTEFGRLAALMHAQDDAASPLERELMRVTRVVTAVALGLGALCFTAGITLGGLSVAGAFLFGIGIIVANVPEGLLPTLTLALAAGVRRMAARQALVKRLSAVEALGATDVILSDKTGTLTENEMRVCEAWTTWGLVRLGDDRGAGAPTSEAGSALEEMLATAALCCDAHLETTRAADGRWHAVGDPTETAILVAAAERGMTADRLGAHVRLAELPFDSARKRMTTVHAVGGVATACVKGAASEMLARCASVRGPGGVSPLDDAARRAAQAAHDALAGRGLRVLAIASRVLGEAPAGEPWSESVEQELTLLGFLAMEDPPRPEVAPALAACRGAGIRVVMVTGDDPLTASAIGREIGLTGDGVRAVTGGELETLDQVALDRLIEHDQLLFARVAPEHKLRLVQAFQRRGAVVAVTGDGVNDAPALRRADVGVAMGATGTDVAREAADVVLADDNFASIVAAVEEGRAVFDNVRKFVTYIFASNVPEIVPFVVFVLFGVPLPLTVLQVLAVDLGTDLLPALALGLEPPEPGVMQRAPRSRGERLLDRPTLLRAYAWLGAIEAVLCLGGYFAAYWLAGWRPGAPMADSGIVYATATTMSLAGIVACQIGNVFVCRSLERPSWRLGLGANRALLAGIAVEVGLLLALIYLPGLASVFGLAPLGLAHWAILLTFPPLLLVLEETRRALARRWWRAPAAAASAQAGAGFRSARLPGREVSRD